MSELMLDVGQANEIKLAARRAGATNTDLKRLSEGDVFAKILPYLRGVADVVVTKHIIDCDAEPFLSKGWKVEKHHKDGQLEWGFEISLYLSKQQKDSKVSEGNKLRKELEKMPVLNANVLDYLLKNPHLIPEDWKGKAVFFWGTIYRDNDGNPGVRYLSWSVDKWIWDRRWLAYGFNSGSPAALRAS